VTREPENLRTGTAWRRSSRSQYNNCVEVRFVGDSVSLRNSRDPAGPVLLFTAPEWDAFVEGVKRGEFGRPEP
jgi:hypothetical protein